MGQLFSKQSNTQYNTKFGLNDKNYYEYFYLIFTSYIYYFIIKPLDNKNNKNSKEIQIFSQFPLDLIKLIFRYYRSPFTFILNNTTKKEIDYDLYYTRYDNNLICKTTLQDKTGLVLLNFRMRDTFGEKKKKKKKSSAKKK